MSSPTLGGARRREARARRRFRPGATPLESRVALSGDLATPTGEEQYMLELINRARANPAAEAQRLRALAASDPLIASALWPGELEAFSAAIAAMPPAPPLAFNTRLIAAARSHNGAMLAANAQRHAPAGFLSDPAVARAADGQAYYPPTGGSMTTGENVFAFSRNVDRMFLKEYVDYYHAGLMIDWGNPDFGHLKNLLAPGPAGWAPGNLRVPFAEVGIALLADAHPGGPPDASPAYVRNSGLDVGPVLVTQEFGWRTGQAFLTGTFSRDADGDNFYSPGEGIGGVTVRAVGRQGQGAFQATTWDSGGYSLRLPPGTYDVVASGNMPGTRTAVITIGANNVGWSQQVVAAAPSETPVPGDYDGDGRANPATYRRDRGTWTIGHAWGGSTVVHWGVSNLDLPVPADYDGDGKTDVAVYRPTTGEWFILQSRDGFRYERWGVGGVDVPVPADYDGDGRADFAVYRPPSGEWFLLRSREGFGHRAWGVGGLDAPVPADYDGDGRADFAVYRRSSGEWLLQQSRDGFGYRAWGIPSLDLPVPGRYDGDGRADFAVYRPTTGEWFLQQSRDGLGYRAWGVGGLDAPAAADYDGDGRADFAVFRPTDATWLIRGTRRGYFGYQAGKGGTPTPTATQLVSRPLAEFSAWTARAGVPAGRADLAEAVPAATPEVGPKPAERDARPEPPPAPPRRAFPRFLTRFRTRPA